MGVVNLTPDSFSDGGAHPDLESALAVAEAMIGAGAALLDVGGESTRPGAVSVGTTDELDRVLPFIREATRRFGVPLSIDTRKAEVAAAALNAGAVAVNDVSGLSHDPDMAGVVARTGAGLVLMHMRGDPTTMTGLTDYDDVVRDVGEELAASARRAIEAGIARQAIVLDPGLGFAKTAAQSLRILRDLDRLLDLGYPILVGPSRKSFLGAVLGLPAEERLEGTIAACIAGYHGGARLFRVHDVAPVARALAVAHAIECPEIVE
jgi:dihydropteroate synthase